MIILLALFIVSFGSILSIVDYNITGFVVSEPFDQELYSHKISSSVEEKLDTIYSFRKEDYLLKLNNYNEGLKEIKSIISERDIVEFELFNIVKVSARRNDILRIIKSENVEIIESNLKVRSTRSNSLEYLGVNQVRREIHNPFYDVKGEGIKIAILDSGLEWDNEYYCNPNETNCKIKQWRSVLDGSDNALVEINRTITQDKFADNYRSKQINLSLENKTLFFSLLGNKDQINNLSATITFSKASKKNARLNLTCGPDQNLTINNEIADETETPKDISSCFNISNCVEKSEKPGVCLFNVTVSGSGDVLIYGINITYNVTKRERIGNATDSTGHGTRVAGILDATAPKSDLYIYKVLDENEVGDLSDIIEGLQYAIYDGVDIITMSLGVDSENGCAVSNGYVNILKSAIQTANDFGITVVAAGGNNNSRNVAIPACFDNTIAIGGIDKQGMPMEFSHGPELDFVMPAEGIVSTNLLGLDIASGTSFATPFAVGVISLIQEKAKHDTGIKLPNSVLREFLVSNAQRLNEEDKTAETGYGLLNYSKLVDAYNSGIWYLTKDKLNFSINNFQENIKIFSTKNLEVEINWTNKKNNLGNEVPLRILLDGEVEASNFTKEITNGSSLLTFSVDKDYIESTNSEMDLEIKIIDKSNSSNSIKIPVKIFGNNNTIDSEHKFGIFQNLQLFINFEPRESTLDEILDNNKNNIHNLGDLSVVLKIKEGQILSDEIYISLYNSSDELITTRTFNDLSSELFSYDDELYKAYLYEYFLYEVGKYKIRVYIEEDGLEKIITESEFEVFDNISIEVHNDYLLSGKEYTIEDLNYSVEYNSMLKLNNFVDIFCTIHESNFCSRELLNIYINDEIIENNEITNLSEGLHNVTFEIWDYGIIGYTYRQGESFPNEIKLNSGNHTKEIFLFGDVNITTNDSKIILTEEKQFVDFKIERERNENIYDSTISLTISENCQDQVLFRINQTEEFYYKSNSFINLSGEKEIEVELLNNASSFKECNLTLDVNYKINISDDNNIDYSKSHLLEIKVYPINRYLEMNISNEDPKIFIGDKDAITISLNNTGDTEIVGELYLYFSDSSGENSTKLGTYTIQPNALLNVTSEKTFVSIGNNIIRSIFNNSNLRLEKTKQITVLDNPINHTAKVLGQAFRGNETTISLIVQNNNNKDVDVSVEITNETNLRRISYRDYMHQSTLSYNASQTFNFNYDTINSGVAKIVGIVKSGNFNKSFEFSFNVNAGLTINADLRESFTRQRLSFDDKLVFVVDKDCENVNRECENSCNSDNRTCKIKCDDLYSIENEKYSVCREECNKYSDSYDRSLCRDRCSDDRNYALELRSDCYYDCQYNWEDCDLDCDYDFSVCQDESSVVEVTADWYQGDNYITLYALGRNTYERKMRIDQSFKFDFDDDGYYETEIVLNRLIVSDDYRCEEDCREKRDSDRDRCKDEETHCIESCSQTDFSCRTDCRRDSTYCNNEVRERYDDCVGDCEIEYGSYEIRLRKIDLEPVRRVIDNVTINDTQQNITQNDTSKNEPEPPEPTCDSNNLNLCKTAEECGLAMGYWYDRRCNKELKPPEPEPEPPQPRPPEPEPQPRPPEPEPEPRPPQIEEPRDSSGMNILIYVFVVVLLAGAGVAIFVFKGHSSHTSHSKKKNKSTTQVLENPEELKLKKLEEYFVKQMMKGNNIEFIADSLKKLGWNGVLVDKVVQGFLNDKTKQMIIKIAKFGLDNNMDSQSINLRFGVYGPDIIQPAINIMNKFKPE